MSFENAYRCKCGRIQHQDMLDEGEIADQNLKRVTPEFVCPDCGAPYHAQSKVTGRWLIEVERTDGRTPSRIKSMKFNLSPYQVKMDAPPES